MHGLLPRLVDEIVGRLIDALLALPLIVFADRRDRRARQLDVPTLIIVIGVVFTPIVARTVRAAVLAERELDYVQAAKLRGERAPYIMFVEILPNIMGPIIVEATVRLGYAIFARRGHHVPRLRRAAAVARLVARRSPPDSNLNDTCSRRLLLWTVLFPGLAIIVDLRGVNLLADGLQQVFDR